MGTCFININTKVPQNECRCPHGYSGKYCEVIKKYNALTSYLYHCSENGSILSQILTLN